MPPELGQAVLAALDTNGDHQVALDDLAGVVGADATLSELNGFDTNGDGRVDLNDLPPNAGERLVELLSARNADGSISIDDLPQV